MMFREVMFEFCGRNGCDLLNMMLLLLFFMVSVGVYLFFRR